MGDIGTNVQKVCVARNGRCYHEDPRGCINSPFYSQFYVDEVRRR